MPKTSRLPDGCRNARINIERRARVDFFDSVMPTERQARPPLTCRHY